MNSTTIQYNNEDNNKCKHCKTCKTYSVCRTDKEGNQCVKRIIKVQKAELATESSSKDLQTITTQLAVNYKVDGDMASNLYKTVGNSYEATILIPAIQESIKAIISEYTAEQTITLRNNVSDKCLDEIQSKVQKYGIIITDFNIIDLDFSVAYNQAIEEKQVAEQKF